MQDGVASLAGTVVAMPADSVGGVGDSTLRPRQMIQRARTLVDVDQNVSLRSPVRLCQRGDFSLRRRR
jgi:hypothetical protein